MKKTLTALLSLSLLPMTAFSAAIVSPHEGTVIATTYYSSGTFHGALDIASGKTCGSVPLDAPIQASVSWNLTIRTAGKVCYGGGSSGSHNASTWTEAKPSAVPRSSDSQSVDAVPQ